MRLVAHVNYLKGCHMHVLTILGRPVAVAERFQRLCMEMASYPDQADMDITSVPELD